MNIFFLDEKPSRAAQYHFDKHVNKMIVESAQLLSTTHRVLDGKPTIYKDRANRNRQTYVMSCDKNDILYKSTHVNHPSAKWVRKSCDNYKWLYQLFVELLNEYFIRFNKTHKSSELLDVLKEVPQNIGNIGFINPPSVMDAKYIISDDYVLNYRYYYVYGKNNMAKYTNREFPEWYRRL